MTAPERAAAVAKLRELLDYRLPNSGKPLSTIVLSREQGEAILSELNSLYALDAARGDKA